MYWLPKWPNLPSHQPGHLVIVSGIKLDITATTAAYIKHYQPNNAGTPAYIEPNDSWQ